MGQNLDVPRSYNPGTHRITVRALPLAETLRDGIVQACDAVRCSPFYQSIGTQACSDQAWRPTPLQCRLWREALSGRDALCVSDSVCEVWVALSAAALAHVRTSAPLRPSDVPIVLFLTPTRE